MADLRSRLLALIHDIEHAPSAPSVEELEDFARRSKELGAELLRTGLSPRDRQELGKHAKLARTLLTAAIDRTKVAADVARAAVEREQHAAQHPTILDRAPTSTSALARHFTGNAFTAAFDRSDDGYDR